MTKKSKRKSTQVLPHQEQGRTASPSANPSVYGKRPMRWDLVILFLAIALGGTYMAIYLRPNSGVPRYTYTVEEKYPHDVSAFTQGLILAEGFLWESTGRNGESSVRKTNLETGEILNKVDLDEKYFGEGLTMFNKELIQLTWRAEKAFVYDLELNKIREHRYLGQGWGLTHDGERLILSDGTARLRFLDPKTFEEIGGVTVRNGNRRVGQLNELEYVNGSVYANQWKSDLIYEIDPQDGNVTAIIDLTNIWPSRERPPEGVMNGIAFNRSTKRLLVTGKLCPHVFEIELQLMEP